MRYSKLTLSALLGLTVAQDATPDLLTALNSTADLSSLNDIVGNLPTEVQQALTSLTDVTILAPNNAAFEALDVPNGTDLTPVLLYHIINGVYQNFTETPQFLPTGLTPETGANLTSLTDGQVVEVVYVNGNNTIFSGLKLNSTTVGSPLNFTGGVIHVINQVLTVPLSVSATAQERALSAFLGSVNATDLVETVDGAPNLTIFAPNNEAFQAIGTGLGDLSTDDLTNILEYHVIVGQVLYSTNLTNTTVPTADDDTELTVTVYNSSTVYVNNARVVVPDILVANGVLHIIDQVLNPDNSTASADPAAGTGEPAFSGASSTADIPNTSGVAEPTGDNPQQTQNNANPTDTSSAGAWQVAPTGLGAALLAGVVLAL